MSIGKKFQKFISNSIEAGIKPAIESTMREVKRTQVLSKTAIVAGGTATIVGTLALYKAKKNESSIMETDGRIDDLQRDVDIITEDKNDTEGEKY